MARQSKANEAETTRPKPLYPPGTTRAVRGKKDVRAAVDVPIEVPVYVYYLRHQSSMGDKPLIGYSAHVECFTFGHRVEVKLSHPQVRGGPRTMEVWVVDREGNRKKVFRYVDERVQVGDPPKTTNEEDEDFSTIAEWFGGAEIPDKIDGWPTELGKKHRAEKAIANRKNKKIAAECKRDNHNLCYQKPWCECDCHVKIDGRISGDDIIFDDEEDDDDEIIWEE